MVTLKVLHISINDCATGVKNLLKYRDLRTDNLRGAAVLRNWAYLTIFK